jgi:putative tryptophan/tyrosine transport system substrate-binding protein
MTRLAALMLVLVALGAPPAALGQTPVRVARIGVLLFSTPTTDPNVGVFRDALRELGWIEGRNLTLDYRFADGQADRLPDLATELAALKPDLIYALGGDVAPFAKRATSTIPIVTMVSNDPVEAGLIASLARPGGNVTGFTFLLSDLAGKRVEILREAAPRVTSVGVLWNPDHPDPDFRESQAAGAALGLRIVSLPVRRPEDFEGAFGTAIRERIDGLIVVSSRLMTRERERILEFGTRRRLPMATGWGAWADGGALLTYGPRISEIVRRSASYVDRILKGARPADLPFERPTRFELTLNRKVAETLGLTIPPALLLRADRVVE